MPCIPLIVDFQSFQSKFAAIWLPQGIPQSVGIVDLNVQLSRMSVELQASNTTELL